MFNRLSALWLFFFVFGSTPVFAQLDVFKTFILEESTLSISGTSNVNNFTCGYLEPIASDTLIHEVAFSDSLYPAGDIIQLQANRFDCGSRPINRDMRKTLKAGDFPFLELSLSTIEIADSLPFTTVLDISIAGVTRKEEIQIIEFVRTDENVSFTGLGTVLLSDFNLKPRSALFGLVKVDDEIQIRFNIFIEQEKG